MYYSSYGVAPRGAIEQLDLDLSTKSRIKIIDVPADGNCLFSSFSTMLSRQTTQKWTADGLRKLVASSIRKQESKAAIQALQHWHEVYCAAFEEKDVALMQEFTFMEPSAGKPWPLDDSTLAQIEESLNNKYKYWAEEYALRFIGQQLAIDIYMFYIERSMSMALRKPLPTEPTTEGSVRPTTKYACCLVLQNNNHYQPMAFGGVYFFPLERPPPELDALESAAVRWNSRPKPTNPYALRPRWNQVESSEVCPRNNLGPSKLSREA